MSEDPIRGESIDYRIEKLERKSLEYPKKVWEEFEKIKKMLENGGINYIAIGEFDARIEKLEKERSWESLNLQWEDFQMRINKLEKLEPQIVLAHQTHDLNHQKLDKGIEKLENKPQLDESVIIARLEKLEADLGLLEILGNCHTNEINELKKFNERTINFENDLGKELNELKDDNKDIYTDLRKIVDNVAEACRNIERVNDKFEKELNELKERINGKGCNMAQYDLEQIVILIDVLREYFDKHGYHYYRNKLGGESKEFCPICYGERLGELNDIEDKEKRYHAIQDFINEEIINGGETSVDVDDGVQLSQESRISHTNTDSTPPSIAVRKEDLERIFSIAIKHANIEDGEWLDKTEERYLKDE